MQTDQTTTESWPEYRDRIFGTPYWIWHDGIPASSIDTLKKENQELLNHMVIEGLNQKDYLAVFIIRNLNFTKFIPRLQKEIKPAKDKFLIELAITLNKLDPENAKHYANDAIIALQDSAWSTRMDAAIALREFSADHVDEALFKTIEKDTEHLVCYHATLSLLHIHHLEQDQIPHYEELFKYVTSDDSHDRKLGIKELMMIIKSQ